MSGGGGAADQVQEHLEHAKEETGSIVAQVIAAVDHHLHELSEGDPMTWAAFVAVVLALVLIIVALKGGITIGRRR